MRLPENDMGYDPSLRPLADLGHRSLTVVARSAPEPVPDVENVELPGEHDESAAHERLSAAGFSLVHGAWRR